jgi:hypothetical protein
MLNVDLFSYYPNLNAQFYLLGNCKFQFFKIFYKYAIFVGVYIDKNHSKSGLLYYFNNKTLSKSNFTFILFTSEI